MTLDGKELGRLRRVADPRQVWAIRPTTTANLGQLVVYASGLEASVVIWFAPDFRDKHRRALDPLNERTDTGVDFFD